LYTLAHKYFWQLFVLQRRERERERERETERERERERESLRVTELMEGVPNKLSLSGKEQTRTETCTGKVWPLPPSWLLTQPCGGSQKVPYVLPPEP